MSYVSTAGCCCGMLLGTKRLDQRWEALRWLATQLAKWMRNRYVITNEVVSAFLHGTLLSSDCGAYGIDGIEERGSAGSEELKAQDMSIIRLFYLYKLRTNYK